MGIAKEYIFNQSETNTKKANVLINDDISKWWGVGLRELANDISTSGATDIMIQICSDGGDVFQGQAMASFIEGYPANIDTCVLGMCASIATLPAMAGKNTYIARGSRFLIHNPTAGLRGEAKDLRDTADLLDSAGEQITDRYVAAIQRNGKLINGNLEETKAQVKEWQNKETSFTAEEAVEHGFIQKVVDGAQFLNKVNSKAIYNSCSKYKNVPVEFLNKVKSVAMAKDEPTAEETKMAQFYNAMKGFFVTEPQAKVETPAPVIEQTKEQELEAAKALLLENGLKIEPVTKVVPPVEDTTEADNLKAQLATVQAEKKAAELKAQQLQEQIQGAGSASKPTMHKATAEKPLNEMQLLENQLAEFGLMESFNNLASAIAEA